MTQEIPAASYGYEDETDEWLREQRLRSSAPDELALRGAFMTCFATPQGEDVLNYLYDFCRAGLPTYVPGDTPQSAFNEGKRRVLLQIMGFIHMDDEELFQRARNAARAIGE